MLKIDMLPAGHGDALWIEYGNPVRRILVDCGTSGTHKAFRKRFKELPANPPPFELLVVTHVDADHIAGVLSLIDSPPAALKFKDHWFNGFKHLSGVEEFGPVQGEKLTAWLTEPADRPWNAKFQKKAVMRGDAGALEKVTLDGDLSLTILGPTKDKLAALRPKWEKECEKAGLKPGVDEAPPVVTPGIEDFGPVDVDELAGQAFSEDEAEANGSSISLLLEHEGKRVLLGADAHPSTLIGAIDLLEGTGKTLKLDAFKVPHHGSKNNLNVDLVKRIRCPRFLFSSNGSHFKHPDRQSVARVLKHGGDGVKHLFFNYDTQFNEMWKDPALQNQWSYTATYGGPAKGLSVSL